MIIDTLTLAYKCPYCKETVRTIFEDEYPDLLECTHCKKAYAAELTVTETLRLRKLKKIVEVETEWLNG